MRSGGKNQKRSASVGVWSLAFAADVLAALSGCPLADGFFVRVENGAEDIAVTVVKLRDFNAQENAGGNVLLIPVQPGHTQLNFVSMDTVGDADAVRIRVEGTDPQQPIGFAVTRVITGGFAAGKTVTITVSGSPTQSVDIEVEPS